MRIGLVILLLGPLSALAQSPVCDSIQALDKRLVEQRIELERLRQRYTDNHPTNALFKSNIETLEVTRAAEVARAASQGLTCAAAPPQRPSTPTPSQNISQ